MQLSLGASFLTSAAEACLKSPNGVGMNLGEDVNMLNQRFVGLRSNFCRAYREN